MKITDIKPGNKLELELYSEKGDIIKPSFVSELEWAEDESSAVIAAPIYEGVIYPVHIGTKMEVFFACRFNEVSRNELFKFSAEVKRRKTLDNIALLEIEVKSEIEKIQRREFFRFDCSIPIKYRQVDSLKKEDNEGIPFKKVFTRDLSGGGLCFVTEEKLDMGKVLEIELSLWEDDIRKFYGTIVRVTKLEEYEKHYYEIGIWFENLENKDREALVKFIFIEQRKLLKKGLI